MNLKHALQQIVSTALVFFPPLLFAQSFDDLAEMDIADLMYLEVTSVSKKSQKLSEAPASIYVLTQDDLQRSGANSVPEALRMVPGLSVAQLDANKWAISTRGFNHLYSNKLLVLVDGITVYSPLFSGVHWDAQDLLLENIDRIEVIRGPGATLWGANAMNGVINITTKQTADTLGIQVTQFIGSNDKTITTGRYGGNLGENGHYRVFGKVRDTRANVDSDGNNAADNWEQARAGIRADWEHGQNDQFTLQFNHYRGRNGETLTIPVNPISFTEGLTKTFEDVIETSSTNVLGRWVHSFSDGSELSIQTYIDTQSRADIFEEQRDTYDIELQHHFPIGTSQEIIWGGGYRLMKSKTNGTNTYAFDPARRNTKLLNAFINDEINLITEKLTAVLGVKVEKNDFTGKEIQPSARMIWTPTKRQSYWAAVSRAVRTPSLNDSDAVINPGVQTEFGTMLTILRGASNLKSENLMAYELGFRAQPRNDLTFDASLYWHEYKNLQGVTFEGTTFPYVNLRFNHKQTGTAKGLDFSFNWQPTVRWKLLAGYSYLDLDLTEEGSNTVATQEKESPKQQFQIRSYLDLNHDIQLNTMLYYVSALKIRDSVIQTNQEVDSYRRVDINIAWQTNKFIKLTTGINNLLQKQHAEFGSVPFVEATKIERSIYAKINIELN